MSQSTLFADTPQPRMYRCRSCGVRRPFGQRHAIRVDGDCHDVHVWREIALRDLHAGSPIGWQIACGYLRRAAQWRQEQR